MVTKFTIFGCCATRDAFNSKINYNYKDYFEIGKDAFHTSIISMMQKPVAYEENSIKRFKNDSRDKIRHRNTKRDFDKSYLNDLKNGNYEYMVLDTYFDVRQGVITIPDQSTYITNSPYINLSDFYKNLENKKILTIQKNTQEYIDLWVNSCNRFFEFLDKYCPDLKVVLNTVRSSTKIINKDGIIYEKKGYGRFIPNHCYRSILDEYILQNFDVDVLIFEKEHLLDENYLFGPAEIHYSYSYYEDVNNQLNEIIHNNLTLDNVINKKIRFLKRKYANSLFYDEIIDKNQKTLLNIMSKLDYDFNSSVLNSKLIKNFEKIIKNQDKNLISSQNIFDDFNLARFDIINKGSEVNNIEVSEVSDSDCSISKPKWFKSDNGQGIVMQSNKGNLTFKLKCIGGGMLSIKLKGPDMKGENKETYPIFIDFTSLKINNKEMLSENKLTWFKKPHSINIQCNDNEILDIKVKWLPLNSNRISNKYKQNHISM